MKLIHKDREFIKHYSNASLKSSIIRDLLNTESTEETILSGTKSLIEVYKILLEGSKHHIDYQNYIRWNSVTNLEIISSSFSGFGEIFDEKKKLSKELEKRLEEINYENSSKVSLGQLKTKICEVISTSEFLEKRLINIENPIITEKIKKLVTHLLNCLTGIFVSWPYYTDYLVESKMKSYHDDCFIYLDKSGLHSEKTKLTNLYYATLEKVEGELTLGKNQDEMIRLSLQTHYEYERKSLYSQIVERCGEYYESLREEMNILKNATFSLGNLIVSPIKSPIQFLSNIWFAVNNIRAVGKEIWSYVYDHPGKTAGFILGSVAVGCLLGWLSTALVTGSLVFAAADMAIAGCVGLLTGASAVANAATIVKNSIEKVGCNKVDSEIEKRIARVNAHQNAMNAAKKAYLDELRKSFNKAGIRVYDGDNNQFNDEKDWIDKLNKKKELILTCSNQLLESKEKAVEIVNEALEIIENVEKEIENTCINQEIQMDNLNKTNDIIFENSNLNNNSVEQHQIKPLFLKWVTNFANECDFNKVAYISNMMSTGKYKELDDYLNILELLDHEAEQFEDNDVDVDESAKLIKQL